MLPNGTCSALGMSQTEPISLTEFAATYMGTDIGSASAASTARHLLGVATEAADSWSSSAAREFGLLGAGAEVISASTARRYLQQVGLPGVPGGGMQAPPSSVPMRSDLNLTSRLGHVDQVMTGCCLYSLFRAVLCVECT